MFALLMKHDIKKSFSIMPASLYADEVVHEEVIYRKYWYYFNKWNLSHIFNV